MLFSMGIQLQETWKGALLALHNKIHDLQKCNLPSFVIGRLTTY